MARYLRTPLIGVSLPANRSCPAHAIAITSTRTLRTESSKSTNVKPSVVPLR